MNDAASSGGLSRAGALFFALLLASRLVMLVPAFEDLAVGDGGVDLESRRAELEFALHGVAPGAAILRLEDVSRVKRGLPPRHDGLELPDLDALHVGALSDGDFGQVNPTFGAYPQWSYPLMAPLLWPPEPYTRPYYSIVLAACFAALCWWAASTCEGTWRWLALLVLLIPMPAWAAAVFTGQLSIPLLVTLAGFGAALARERWVLAGLLIGIAAMKPTFAALFAFALLAPVLGDSQKWRGALRAAGVAATVVIGSSLLMWWATAAAPWTALLHLARANADTLERGYGLLPRVMALSESSGWNQWVTFIFAAVGLAASLATALLLRGRELLLWFAILGLLSRLWTYHRHYDDVLLVFLLLALVRLTQRGSLLSLGALFAMAMTLAAPLPLSERFEIWRCTVWIVAGVVMLHEARRFPHRLTADVTAPTPLASTRVDRP